MEARSYRVERAPRAADKVPPGYVAVLKALKKGETVSTAVLYDRLGGTMSRATTKAGAMARLRKAMAFARGAGIVADVTVPSSRPYEEFLRIPCVAQWIAMLNAPNTLHAKGRWGGTRSVYGYALYRFSEWASGRTVEVASREPAGSGGAYREVRRQVELRGADHVLELALESGGIGREIAVLIRTFFAEMNEQRRYSPVVAPYKSL